MISIWSGRHPPLVIEFDHFTIAQTDPPGQAPGGHQHAVGLHVFGVERVRNSFLSASFIVDLRVAEVEVLPDTCPLQPDLPRTR